jgi:CPA1 family monovalent cation:H+ antiporter
MSRLDLLALLLTNAAAAEFINIKWLRLPAQIGLLIESLVLSLAVILLGRVFGLTGLTSFTRDTVNLANLPGFLFHGALGFLLFAAALDVSLTDLRNRAPTVLALATIGVVLASVFYAFGIWEVFRLTRSAVPLKWCVVLGAILAPTDPVAVSGILQRMALPTSLKSVVTGESLFNDGVAIVIFTVALEVASGNSDAGAPGAVLLDFAREGLGGIALGLATGGIAVAMLRFVDEYNIELMISLALVTATYAAAMRVGASGPLAVVIAGLVMGNAGMSRVMSELTRRNVALFWSLIDRILNAVLFLLLGLQMVAIRPTPMWPVIVASGIVLAAVVRFLATGIPGIPLNLDRSHHLRALTILTWGGLRGGISVALALSLPFSPSRDMLLIVSYGVVVFTIIGQGLTLPWVIRRLFPD